MQPMGLLVAGFDASPLAEDEFDDWYDTEHIPNILKVPGVLGITRFRDHGPNEHGWLVYSALYYLADADLSHAIVKGCRRVEPAMDFLTAHEAGLRGRWATCWTGRRTLPRNFLSSRSCEPSVGGMARAEDATTNWKPTRC